MRYCENNMSLRLIVDAKPQVPICMACTLKDTCVTSSLRQQANTQRVTAWSWLPHSDSEGCCWRSYSRRFGITTFLGRQANDYDSWCFFQLYRLVKNLGTVVLFNVNFRFSRLHVNTKFSIFFYLNHLQTLLTTDLFKEIKS